MLRRGRAVAIRFGKEVCTVCGSRAVYRYKEAGEDGRRKWKVFLCEGCLNNLVQYFSEVNVSIKKTRVD